MIKNSVVKSFLGSFKDLLNEGMLREKVIKSYGIENLNAASIQSDVINKYGTDFVNTKEIEKSKSAKLGSFQYFSVSMLIFFLLTSGMGLGIGIVDDKSEKLYSRISSYPVKSSQYLLGKALGNGVIGIFQAATIIIFTSLVFKVNWGNNYPGLALVVLTVLFSSSGMAVILSNFINSSKALSTALIVIYWCITFVSGAFAPIPAFEPAGRFTLNKWAFEAIASFMAGRGFGYAANYLMLLTGLCLVLWMIGIMLYRRRASNE
jgi:ABC-2 type transport system permease protein